MLLATLPVLVRVFVECESLCCRCHDSTSWQHWQRCTTRLAALRDQTPPAHTSSNLRGTTIYQGPPPAGSKGSRSPSMFPSTMRILGSLRCYSGTWQRPFLRLAEFVVCAIDLCSGRVVQFVVRVPYLISVRHILQRWGLIMVRMTSHALSCVIFPWICVGHVPFRTCCCARDILDAVPASLTSSAVRNCAILPGHQQEAETASAYLDQCSWELCRLVTPCLELCQGRLR